MNTAVRLSREIMRRPWYSDLNMRGLFLHALVVANSSGSFTAGRAELAEATGISEQSIRTAMKKLMDFGELTISATNKYSVITVLNYQDFVCSCEVANQQSDAPTSTESSTWRDSFEQYIAEAEPEWDMLHDDWDWIESKKEFYPGVCIQRSLQKMWEEYWGTEQGWKKKKQQRSATLNWKSTIEKGLGMKFNRVYFARDEQDYEANIIADRRRKREQAEAAQGNLFGN